MNFGVLLLLCVSSLEPRFALGLNLTKAYFDELIAGPSYSLGATKASSNLVGHANCDEVADSNLTISQRQWFDNLGTRQKNAGMTIRKEIRALTKTEWARYMYAFSRLSTDKIDGLTKYQILSRLHAGLHVAPEAHLSTTVLPWHREEFYRIEAALQEYDSSIGLPYYSIIHDLDLPSFNDSDAFSYNLLGSTYGRTIASWANNVNVKDCPQYPYVVRFLKRGSRTASAIVWLTFVQGMMLYENYKEMHASFLKFSNRIHAHLHDLIGGDFGAFDEQACKGEGSTSGGLYALDDPLFHVIHTWLVMQLDAYQRFFQKEVVYPADSEIIQTCEFAKAKAVPFKNMTVLDLMDKDGTLFETVTYQALPFACEEDSDCLNDYFWCNTGTPEHGQCMGKIVVGGYCANLTDTACYGTSKCVDDYCSI